MRPIFPVVPLLVLALGASAADQRKLWAYPRGVLVTSQGRVSAPSEEKKEEKKDRTKEEEDKEKAKQRERDEALKPTGDELTALGKKIEGKMTDCLAALREKTPELVQTGQRYSFELDFQIGADGSVDNVQEQKKAGSAPLPDCADAAKKQLAAHHFEPSVLGTQLDGRLDLEGLIMTDEEAKGRGYAFYEAEKAWEQAKKAHKEWFTCKVDADCVVVNDACELRGVGSAHLQEYKAAASARKKPGCRDAVDLAGYKAACRHGTCSAKRR